MAKKVRRGMCSRTRVERRKSWGGMARDVRSKGVLGKGLHCSSLRWVFFAELARIASLVRARLSIPVLKSRPVTLIVLVEGQG